MVTIGCDWLQLVTIGAIGFDWCNWLQFVMIGDAFEEEVASIYDN